MSTNAYIYGITIGIYGDKMPIKDPIKRREYNKLLNRRRRNSKLDVPGKTILELISKKKLKIEMVEEFMKNTFPDASNWSVLWKYDDEKHDEGQFRGVVSHNNLIASFGGHTQRCVPELIKKIEEANEGVGNE